MAVVQGAPDVGFKRKAAEDNPIYDWHQDDRAFQVMAKQYEKNETIGTKLIKGAEAAGIKAKGLAEAAGIKVKDNAEAFVMRTDANANAIKIEAEAKKTEAEAKLLEFELTQKQKKAGIATGAEPELCAVPLAIFANSKPRKPLTREQMDNNNRKVRERRAEQKKNKENAAEDL